MRKATRLSTQMAMLGGAAIVAAALAGCGSSTKAVTAPAGAQNIYFTGDSSSAMQGFVYSFAADTNGAALPSATFTPPAGFFVSCVAFGPNGTMYVGGENSSSEYQILEYAAGATSSSSPIATYTGTEGSFSAPSYLAVNSAGQLFVEDSDGYISVFAANAATGALPVQFLTYLADGETFSAGIGADSAGNIYVAEVGGGGILVFAAGATGSTGPVRTITSTTTATFGNLYGMTADAAGNVFVANYNESEDPFQAVRPMPILNAGARTPRDYSQWLLRWGPGRRTGVRPATASPRTTPVLSTGIYMFAAGSTGSVAPVYSITGATTTVVEPLSIAVDAADNIYYADVEGGSPVIMVFPAGTNGNVTPKNTFSSAYLLENEGPDNIAVY